MAIHHDDNDKHMLPEGILELVRAHVRGEAEQDVDAILATLCDSPHYEIHPAGFILTTRDAIREWYVRMLPLFEELIPHKASATYEQGDRTKFIGPMGIMTMDYATHRDESGRETEIKSTAFFEPDPESGLLKGEHIFTNEATTALFLKKLGDDFESVPGVSRE